MGELQIRNKCTNIPPRANPISFPNALNATAERITTYATVILTQFSNPPIVYSGIKIKIFDSKTCAFRGVKIVEQNVLGQWSFQYAHVSNKGGYFEKVQRFVSKCHL